MPPHLTANAADNQRDLVTDAVPKTIEGAVKLERSLGLWLSVLYGLGVTIGAGIYVLIAPTVARAGMQAPLAFILAALVMAPLRHHSPNSPHACR